MEDFGDIEKWRWVRSSADHEVQVIDSWNDLGQECADDEKDEVFREENARRYDMREVCKTSVSSCRNERKVFDRNRIQQTATLPSA